MKALLIIITFVTLCANAAFNQAPKLDLNSIEQSINHNLNSFKGIELTSRHTGQALGLPKEEIINFKKIKIVKSFHNGKEQMLIAKLVFNSKDQIYTIKVLLPMSVRKKDQITNALLNITKLKHKLSASRT